MPVVPPLITAPIREEFLASLPQRVTTHPLGCHRRRSPDEVVSDKLVAVLVSGMGTSEWRTRRARRQREADGLNHAAAPGRHALPCGGEAVPHGCAVGALLARFRGSSRSGSR
ncbi:hypothetical protein GCM10010424_37850 [Streptomyces lienomycini]